MHHFHPCKDFVHHFSIVWCIANSVRNRVTNDFCKCIVRALLRIYTMHQHTSYNCSGSSGRIKLIHEGCEEYAVKLYSAWVFGSRPYENLYIEPKDRRGRKTAWISESHLEVIFLKSELKSSGRLFLAALTNWTTLTVSRSALRYQKGTVRTLHMVCVDDCTSMY